jgi:hypothetical protein
VKAIRTIPGWWQLTILAVLSAMSVVAIAQTTGAPVTTSFSGLVYNRATQTFNSVLTLTNTGPGTIQSPMSVVIATGTAAVTVAGTTDGATYIANLPGGSLGPSASAKLVVEFVDPTRVAFTPSITGIGVSVIVAQATITSAAGGTITVTGGGNPLSGTQVIIPPGALGDPTDTITLGYTTGLPAPLPPKAAGIVPLFPYAITLTKTGPTPFQADIQVTMPFTATALGANDYPLVGYWSANLQSYEPALVVSFDRTAGLVTFETKHFTSFVVLAVPGLVDMLSGNIPFAPQFVSIDTGFTPAVDGFEIENFSSIFLSASSGGGGVCFGLTSYAAWYFSAIKPTSNEGLFSHYQAASDPGLTHIAQEDAVAREVVERTYAETIKDTALVDGQSDAQTVYSFIAWMLLSGGPQLAVVAPGATSSHSVLVYNWEARSLSLGIYDPNVPAPRPQPPRLTLSGAFFSSWTSGGTTYNHVWFDAYGTHYDEQQLRRIYDDYDAGNPALVDGTGITWYFNSLQVTSPLGSAAGIYPYGTNGVGSVATISVSAAGGTALSVNWSQSLVNTNGTSYLHVYQNNQEQGAFPLTDGAATIMTQPLSGAGADEFLAFVSKSASDPGPYFADPQEDTVTGYAAFLRAELMPVTGVLTPANPLISVGAQQVFTMTVSGSIPPDATYNWTVTGAGSIGASVTTGNQVTFTAANSPGPATLSVVILDANGNMLVKASTSFTVNATGCYSKEGSLANPTSGYTIALNDIAPNGTIEGTIQRIGTWKGSVNFSDPPYTSTAYESDVTTVSTYQPGSASNGTTKVATFGSATEDASFVIYGTTETATSGGGTKTGTAVLNPPLPFGQVISQLAVGGPAINLQYAGIGTTAGTSTQFSYTESWQLIDTPIVTTDAGTFKTCQYQIVTSISPHSLDTKYKLYGYGFEVMETTSDTTSGTPVLQDTQKATSVILNGAPYGGP